MAAKPSARPQRESGPCGMRSSPARADRPLAATPQAGLLSSRSRQPGCDRLPARGLLGRLGIANGVEDQADDRPPRDQHQPAVGTTDEQGRDEDYHVGIAARGDEPELAVDRPPDMDMHAPELTHEGALDNALGDISADDRPQ